MRSPWTWAWWCVAGLDSWSLTEEWPVLLWPRGTGQCLLQKHLEKHIYKIKKSFTQRLIVSFWTSRQVCLIHVINCVVFNCLKYFVHCSTVCVLRVLSGPEARSGRWVRRSTKTHRLWRTLDSCLDLSLVWTSAGLSHFCPETSS